MIFEALSIHFTPVLVIELLELRGRLDHNGGLSGTWWSACRRSGNGRRC